MTEEIIDVECEPCPLRLPMRAEMVYLTITTPVDPDRKHYTDVLNYWGLDADQVFAHKICAAYYKQLILGKCSEADFLNRVKKIAVLCPRLRKQP